MIKLGAVGDVIRTTALLSPLRSHYPLHAIWWLTNTPEIVPSTVAKRLSFSLETIVLLENTEFDVVINLDKDLHACALASKVSAKKKFGFVLKDGVPAPANELAHHKFATGLFDDVSKLNTRSYPQEMFDICGFEFNGEEYEIDPPGECPFTLPGTGPVIGLNTGCGDRWISREWPIESWYALIGHLHNEGYRVVLLGGPAEHLRNEYLAKQTAAYYHGTYPLREFCAVVNSCDVVVSAVTMAMHVALALRKRLVLFNNIFNKYEFELYGRGIILEPEKECFCYFKQQCIHEDYQCMNFLAVETVLMAVRQQVALCTPASESTSHQPT